jgi:hypothetical protein
VHSYAASSVVRSIKALGGNSRSHTWTTMRSAKHLLSAHMGMRK